MTQAIRSIGSANGRGRLRVALTDDHAVVRSGYRRLLEMEDGMDVVAEFSDGEDTLRWLASHEADVLVLDLSMPGQGGLATLRRLHSQSPSLRVLIFTMHDNPALVTQAFEHGAAGYVTKSSPPESLVVAIRRIANGERPVSADVAHAASGKATGAPVPHARLTPAEFEVFLLFARGMNVEEVSRRSAISTKTAANYQTILRRKTGLSTTLDMYRYASQAGLLDKELTH